MPKIYIPGGDDLAKALREPSLLVPARKVYSPVKLKEGLTRPDFAWVNSAPYNVPVDLATGKELAVVNTGEITPLADAWSFSGEFSADRIDLGSIDSDHPLSLQSSSGFTVIVDCYISNNANKPFPRLFDKSDGGGGSDGWSIYYARSTSSFTIGVDGLFTGISGQSANNRYRVIFEGAGPAASDEKRFYIHGPGGWTSATLPTNRTLVSITTNAAIGHWNHSTAERAWDGLIYSAMVYGRRLPLELSQAIALDTHLVLESADSSPYVFPEVSSGVSLLVDSAVHSHQADSSSLTGENSLNSADSLHSHAVGSPAVQADGSTIPTLSDLLATSITGSSITPRVDYNIDTLPGHFLERFIDRTARSLADHPICAPDDFIRRLTDGSAGDWAVDAGAMTITNNLTAATATGNTDLYEWYVMGSAGTAVGRCLRDLPAQCIIRSRFEFANDTQQDGVCLSYTDNTHFLLLQMRGSDGRVRMVEQDGTFQPALWTETSAFVFGEIVEVEIVKNNDLIDVFLNNQPMGSQVDLSADITTTLTDTHAIRLQSDTVKVYSYDVLPYRVITRRYVSAAGNDSTGDGSIATPWATWNKIETEIKAGNSAGFRYCLNRGDTFSQSLTDLRPDVDADATGTGTSFDDWAPIEFDSYGDGARPIISGMTTLSFTGPDGNGEYLDAGAGDQRGILVDDGVIQNGGGSNNKTARTTPLYSPPAIGTLGAGEWTCEGDGSDVYYKPTGGGAPAGVVELATSGQALNLNGADFVSVRNIDFRGCISAVGAIGGDRGASWIWIEHVDTSYGRSGIIYGENSGTPTTATQWRIWDHKSTGMYWRGSGSGGADLASGVLKVSKFNWVIHDNFVIPATGGDHEPTMDGPGDGGTIDDPNDFVIGSYLKLVQNGWRDEYGDYSSGQYDGNPGMHPGAINLDGACARYFMVLTDKSRMAAGLFLNTRDQVVYGEAQNWIALRSGSDKGNRGRHNFFVIKTNNDASQNGATGVMRFCSIVDGDMEGSTITDGGVIVHTKDDPVNIRMDCRFNAWSDWTGGVLYNIEDDGAGSTLDLVIDNNGYHRTTGTDGAEYDATSYNYINMQDGWGPSDEFDNNSVFGDLLLDVNFKPSAVSPLKGIADDTLSIGLDFFLNVRTGDTAGAVEAD